MFNQKKFNYQVADIIFKQFDLEASEQDIKSMVKSIEGSMEFTEEDVMYMINASEAFRTKETVEWFLSFEPNDSDFIKLISSVPEIREFESVNKRFSKITNIRRLQTLIATERYYQNDEALDLYMSIQTNHRRAWFFYQDCAYLRTNQKYKDWLEKLK